MWFTCFFSNIAVKTNFVINWRVFHEFASTAGQKCNVKKKFLSFPIPPGMSKNIVHIMPAHSDPLVKASRAERRGGMTMQSVVTR